MKIDEPWLEKLVRPAIQRLIPYSSARNEFSGSARVYLDANESWKSLVDEQGINRYPDPSARELIQKYSSVIGIENERIIAGSGSDEMIDVLIRVFCIPGIDRIITLSPTYGAYEVFAHINDVEVQHISLSPTFTLTADSALQSLRELTSGAGQADATGGGKARLLFLCSPNNPTGNAFPPEVISSLAEAFDGITVVDEAYADFSTAPSAVTLLETHPRLVVLRTLSKAWALAGARVGFMLGDPALVRLARTVAYPYNLGTPAQRLALRALDDTGEVRKLVSQVVEERKRMEEALAAFSCILTVYPSDANFLLVKTADADALMEYFRQRGIIIRNRSHEEGCSGCVRITIGSSAENDAVLAVLDEYDRIERTSKEDT